MTLNKDVVFVEDHTRVIRRSELLRLYEIAGSTRALAEAIGVPHTRVHRHVKGNGDEAKAASYRARVDAARAQWEKDNDPAG